MICPLKREIFAAMAMQGILANDIVRDNDYIYMSREAIKHTDALLAELEKTEK